MGKRTKENGKGRREELPIALWAYRKTKSQVTRASLFSLVYGIEVVILIDLLRLTMKLVEVAKIPREDILEIVEEKRDNIASNNNLYQASMKPS